MTSKAKYCFQDGALNKHWKNEFGQYHREDGPAVENSDGTRIWCKNDKWHREDGPTCIHSDGTFSYYLFNKSFSKENYWKEIEKMKKEREKKKK